MADNIGYTPGAGATIAADDIGGALHQRVKMVLGADGVTNGDVSLANPMPIQGVGELVEQLSAIRTLLQSLTRSVGLAMPDSAGRLLVRIDASSVNLSTSLSCGTLTNQTQVGAISATEQIPSLMRLGAATMRRNIVVT